MKTTIQSSNGTSFHNVTVIASINELLQLLGEPEYTTSDIDEKVQYDWKMETESGSVFTVYDWKEYRKLIKTEDIEWHIGARDFSSSMDGGHELQAALDKLRAGELINK